MTCEWPVAGPSGLDLGRAICTVRITPVSEGGKEKGGADPGLRPLDDRWTSRFRSPGSLRKS